MSTSKWSITEQPEQFGSAYALSPSKTASEGIQSIRRTIMLLSILSSVGRSGASLARIVTLSKLSKSTTHRILCALLGEGLVEQDVKSRRYRLGAQISVLSAVMGQQFDLRIAGHAALRRLADLTEDAAYFGVRTHYDGLCLDLVEGAQRHEGLRLRANECWPLGVGAFSIVLLAFLPDEEISRIVDHNKRYLATQTHYTAEYIYEQISIARQNGYACSRNLGSQQMAAAAVPVFDPHWRPFASLCVTTTLERFSTERESEIVRLLLIESEKITSEWRELGSISRPTTWHKGLAISI